MKLKYKFLLGLFVFLLCYTTYLKVLGSTELGINVEERGYCKQYGNDWTSNSKENYCYNRLDSRDKVYFTEQEFRNYCPDNKFLSTRLYSKCFFAGDSF